MTNKTYGKIKNFINDNYKFIIFLVFIFLFFNVKLPYYITTSGGLIDIDSRIEIENKKEVSGSFNLAYVNEFNATIPLLLIAKLNDDWQILKESDIKSETEDIKDVYIRDDLLLKEANNNAIKIGYEKANKNIEIIKNSIYVVYVDKLAKTDLKVGDEILKIDDFKINSKDDIYDYIRSKNENEKLKFLVKNNGKKYERSATTFKKNDEIFIGIMISNVSKYKTDPKIKLKFKDSESGSSGGLMMSLAIYNYLTEEDITKNRKIVGTGTIDENGNVGSIGGVKYKLSGAVKEKADIFFVPDTENYDEVIKFKNEKKYDIEIVPINNIDEAINYLKNLDN